MSEDSKIIKDGALERLAKGIVDVLDHPFSARKSLDFTNYGIRCEICKKEDFEGDRYKCANCVNYNLCSPCFSTRHEKSNHDCNHPFLRISNPLTKQENDKLNEIPSLFHKINDTLKNEQLNQFICKFCGFRLFGVRIKCDICENVNLCSECWTNKKHENDHNNHPMVLYTFGEFENEKDESIEKIVPKNGCFNILHEVYLKPRLKKAKDIEMKQQNTNNVEKERDGSSIPTILIDCVEVVESDGMDEEGIYRVSAVVNDIQTMKDLYEKNPKKAKVALQKQSPNLAANVLKRYLRELPEPLLTHDLYPAFVNSIELDESAREECIHKLVNKLIPEANKTILIFIFNHLLKIANNGAKNRMHIKNLSTIFGPIFLSPSDTCSDTNMESLFKQNVQQVSIITYMLELHSVGRLLENTTKKETNNSLNNQFVNMVFNRSNISSAPEDTNNKN